jgi:hypothetical protein
MPATEVWEPFTPAFAPHVSGRYTRRAWDPVLHVFEPQRVEATCTRCAAVYGPTTCDSGRVREKITLFASAHLHRDPLPVPKL